MFPNHIINKLFNVLYIDALIFMHMQVYVAIYNLYVLFPESLFFM